MTRAAWISGVLTLAEREDLAQELSKLPYSEEARQTFLDAADEAIDVYVALLVPMQRDSIERKARVKRLGTAAREFAESVADLDKDSEDLVEQSMWAAEGKGKFAHFHVVRDAGKLADRVAGGCRHWIERNSQPPGPKTVGAIKGLIGDLGQAYLAAVGERPSASPNGVFVKSLTAICHAAALPVRFSEPDQTPKHDDTNDTDDAVEVIGKTRLAQIIKTRVIGGTQPRRGRIRLT